MNTTQLRIFVHVARRGSFAAARDLDMDASAISRAVAALEAELDTRLMHRTTRTMSLTELGLGLAAGRLINLFPGHDATATSFDTAAWHIYASRRYTQGRCGL